MGHIKDRWYTHDKRPTTRHGTGLRWQVWYQVDGRPTCGGSFAKKTDARKHLTEMESRLLRGSWVDPSNTTTVAAYQRQYVAARPHCPSTARRAESTLRNHIEAVPLGAMRIISVKPSDIQAWVTDRSKVLGRRTLQLVVTQVRSAFAAAVADRVIPASPFVGISMPRVDSERVVPLTVEQVRALAAAMRPRYRAMVLTQAGLGLRIGELLALRVGDVDFLRRTARVEHQIDRVTRERIPPKTPKSRRTLPLPTMVSEALAQHLAEHPPAPSGLLFHTRTGLPHWCEHYSRSVFNPAVVTAKLPDGTTSHDLRHHYASVLLAAGESVIAVAERLGHEDATLVLKTYGHLMPGTEERTRKAIDAAWTAASQASDHPATAPGRPG